MTTIKPRLLISFFAFNSLLILFALCSPSVPDSTSALTDTSNSELTMTLDPAISVAVPNNINLSFTPSAPDKDGHVDVHTASGTVAVYTNNATGYTLSVKSNTDSTDLTNSSASSSNILAALSPNGAIVDTVGSKAIDEFEANKWGYLSSCTTTPSGSSTPITVDCYRGVTNGGANIKTTSSAGSDSTTFTVGAKADLTRAPGKYTGEVMFSAVTNLPPPYMQDVATWGSSVALGETVEAVDNRDNEHYYVSRLCTAGSATGTCTASKLWMIDNLRLGGTTTTVLTPADTNIASNYTLPASSTTGFVYPGAYNTAAINATYKNNTTTSYGSGSGKIGTYYNFCAASANTYCYVYGSGTGNAQYDICPRDWRMPTGGSGGEYQTLYAAYNDRVSDFVSALSVPLSGAFYDGSAMHQNFYGLFWSSTYYDASAMSILVFDDSSIYTAYQGYRESGYSIRCVAR